MKSVISSVKRQPHQMVVWHTRNPKLNDLYTDTYPQLGMYGGMLSIISLQKTIRETLPDSLTNGEKNGR